MSTKTPQRATVETLDQLAAWVESTQRAHQQTPTGCSCGWLPDPTSDVYRDYDWNHHSNSQLEDLGDLLPSDTGTSDGEDDWTMPWRAVTEWLFECIDRRDAGEFDDNEDWETEFREYHAEVYGFGPMRLTPERLAIIERGRRWRSLPPPIEETRYSDLRLPIDPTLPESEQTWIGNMGRKGRPPRGQW